MSVLNKKTKFSGKSLYDRRYRLGLTQSDIAKKIGRTFNAVSQWEKGKCKPNPKSLLLLAKALKVDPDYFFQA